MNDKVERHYASRSLVDSVLAAVDEALPSQPKPTDLAPLDQFHAGGLEASRMLATLAGLAPGQRVLDVGCGIGGPARFLAETFGCSVVGIDLTAEYCRLAEALTQRVGLADKVSFRPADALDLPFDAASFDAVWTQHVAMNIADRPRLYREIHRVLRPGGKLALYDAVAGSGDPLFPVPWARDASTSFLLTPEALRTVLEQSGFAIVAWRDVTPEASRWFAARAGATPQKLGLHLLMGPDFRTMAVNFGRSVLEGRVGLLMAVAQKSTA
ncbi:Ubiquinone/menaquinone biosynthesis C-methylase UbiE [Enhydrobacter aerosaccus]|uniref:Ubiquinone/menaquinone biosynthesis C-methylase UbiE n=1 Tax=Enhydrobacter aerosaccus TaxID=225324 RepID=A0A1T4SZW1_9HYPH|nr:methyltransferase domain-containing protein [Enhydrobacter aerosaccus]SKA33669.1 Ubiquinone/menaquinone biosynthesis C-methylase UbiE [Enhydrobacter aerosaccus]